VSPFAGGIVSFSRILNDAEVLVVANTHATQTIAVDVIVDLNLSRAGDRLNILFANNNDPTSPTAVVERPEGTVIVREVDGSVGTGPLHTLRVTLTPMEVQVLGV
jgi:hypothetical protein